MLCEACVQKRSLQLLQKITSRSKLEKIARVPHVKRVQSPTLLTMVLSVAWNCWLCGAVTIILRQCFTDIKSKLSVY